MSEAVPVTAKAPLTNKEAHSQKVQKPELLQSMDSTVEKILFLQRTIGNQAVESLIMSGALSVPEVQQEFEPSRTRYVVIPPELGEPTNDPDALVPADLEMLFQLYTTRYQRFRLMPEGVVFGRDWVMGTTGTAHLRGTIRWKLNRILDQAGQREHLLRFVEGILGIEVRMEELRFMINQAFQLYTSNTTMKTIINAHLHV